MKKKIILFSSLGSAIAGVSYLTFATTSNPAVAATVPALLSLAACPAMCVGMGGMMWFMRRFSKNKNKNNQAFIDHNRVETQQKEVEGSCCGNLQENKKIQNIDYESTNTSKDTPLQPSLWTRKNK